MTDRNTFLSNHKNLKTFVKGLAAKLRILGFQVFECSCDADTAIVKFALNSKEQSVIVYADDTNIISLLLHHYHNKPNLEDIFLTAMTRKSDHQQSKYYSIRGIINQLLKRLFAPIFTGCDTTSAVYQFGKTSIFKKLKNSKRVRNIADIYKNGQNPQTIGTAAFIFFFKLYTCQVSHFLRFVRRNSNLYHHKSKV